MLIKKLLYSLIILAASVALVVSCADESLDPLPTKTVLKGTILALRGAQLETIYFDGELYGESFFGNNVTGNETFDFDTEFLSSDPTSLASFDIYVIRKDWDAAAKKYTSSRVLLTNIPGSQFKKTDDYANPWTSVSLKLTDILAKLGLDPINNPAEGDTLLKRYEFGIAIESDINLTDGTKVLASQIQAAGLFQSDQFYPAQKLSYGVTDVNDSRPSPTITQRGQFSVSGGKAVHTVVPLKDGAKDTIDIKFDQAIDVAPTLTVSPAGAGTLGTLVKVDKSESDFYVVYTATGTSYTGNVTLTVSGATSAEEGALNGLEMEDATKAIAVDNLAPQLVDFTTGTRVGKGGSVVITAKFNEKLGKAPKVTIDVTNTKVDEVTAKSMTLSADGLTATYNYDYKDTDGNAVHGAMAVTIDGGSDAAGNAFGSASKNLVIDIGLPPAPLMVADNTQFDWGTQIKWTITQSTDPVNNPGGSTTGTVYFVAVAAGSAPPTGFVAGDAPAFTMAAGVKAKQNGSVAVTSGTTGSVYTAFTANGSLDIYAVFVGSTGNISTISTTTPVVQDVDPLNGNNVGGNPINVTMN